MRTLIALCVAAAGSVSATNFDGYFKFAGVNMNIITTNGGYNHYVTPGDGAYPLGYKNTSDDLQLAFHLCDRYDDCQWFNSFTDQQPHLVPPGDIGHWTKTPTQDTYVKSSIGSIVKGSTYFEERLLSRLPLSQPRAGCRPLGRWRQLES